MLKLSASVKEKNVKFPFKRNKRKDRVYIEKISYQRKKYLSICLFIQLMLDQN